MDSDGKMALRLILFLLFAHMSLWGIFTIEEHRNRPVEEVAHTFTQEA